MTDETLLRGKRILLVEDEYVLANDLQRIFSEEGANVLGPIASVDDALDLIEAGETIDGAVLDMNLQGEMAFPVADELLDHGTPFVFATGYDRSAVPDRYRNIVCCEKPVSIQTVANALFC
ncbi:DNA-binding response OmpR family regulator [Rhizobium mesoamericanum]|uniref:response regulator n=1 Tax=Rhizobium mesoamericanum TaxID=1079800 RepID=UPI002788CFA7|nr:response regulator [Rhizobium mesoamericanum]MDQ0561144.1 DNA-binding response OmpR family regulator [Rhizobium mesoamericanum]